MSAREWWLTFEINFALLMFVGAALFTLWLTIRVLAWVITQLRRPPLLERRMNAARSQRTYLYLVAREKEQAQQQADADEDLIPALLRRQAD